MYLRFVVAEIHKSSDRELGIFHAAGNLRDAGKLLDHEEQEYDLIRKWFSENLEKPSRFTAAKPPYYRKQSKAISWIKDTAHEHIRRLRSMAEILENHGVAVRTLKSERVGYIVYEDEFQIVAQPFVETPR